MTVAIYLGELIFAIALATTLLAASTLEHFDCHFSVMLRHRGMDLGRIPYASLSVACHCPDTTRDSSRSPASRDRQDLLANMARLRCRLPDGGTTVLAGVLVVYVRYLTFHYCAHHNPAILPASLLKHHLDHHKFANRNYGVTTKLRDRVFGTVLR